MEIDGIRITNNSIESINTNQVIVEGGLGGGSGETLPNYIYLHTQNVASTNWNINHKLATEYVIVNTYDESGQLFIPADITISDPNNISVSNSLAISGKAVIISPPTYARVYVHTQNTPSTTWNVEHNLNTRNYKVNTFTSGGLFYPLSIETIDENTITITNSIPTSGKAVVISQFTPSSGSISVSQGSNSYQLTVPAGENILSGDLIGVANGSGYVYHEWRHQMIKNATTLITTSSNAVADTLVAFELPHDPDSFFVSYSVGSNTFGCVITKSGETLIAGTVALLGTNAGRTRIVQYSGSQYLSTVQNDTYLTTGYIKMINISGNAILDVGTPYTAQNGIYVCRNSTDQFVMSSSDTSFRTLYTLNWSQVSGTFSAGSVFTTPSDTIDDMSFIKYTSGEFLTVADGDLKDAGLARLTKHIISGTTITSPGFIDVNPIFGYSHPESPERPLFIKSNGNFYVGTNQSTVLGGEFGTQTFSQYRRLNTSNMTLTSDIFSGDVGFPAGNHPDASIYISFQSISNAERGNRTGYYEEGVNYDQMISSVSNSEYQNISSAPMWAAYRISQSGSNTLFSIVQIMNSISNSNRAGVVFGNHAALLHFNGLNLVAQLYRVYKPDSFTGIALSNAIQGEDVSVLVRGNYNLINTQTSLKGKFLQIWNGKIITSDVSYKAIGIHNGDSYSLLALDYGSANAAEIYTATLSPTTSLTAIGLTSTLQGAGWYKFKEYVSSGASTNLRNVICLIIDDGSGWRNFSLFSKGDHEFFVPGGRFMIYVAGSTTGNFIKLDLVR